MTRTLITGISGFTGRYLAALLAGKGHEVHGVVHSAPSTDVNGAVRLHQGDIADPVAMNRIVAEVRPDHVVHLAAIAFIAHRDVGEMYRTNILGTRELLASLARLSNPPVSILLASSANIYGNSAHGVLDESISATPANDYGISKAASELVGAVYGDRLPIITVRPFNYIGRGQSVDYLIPKIIAHVRRREATIELGNLDVARDFSDVRFVVEAYAKLLESPDAIGETLNVCSGKATLLADILRMVQALSGHHVEVKVNPAFVRADEVKSLRGTSARLERIIGPLAMPPLEDTLRWMIEE